MAEWTAPFHLPKFTTKEFEKRKAAYHEKHGYTITIPSFDQIIHLNLFKPLTKDEVKRWKRRDYASFSPRRLADIRKYKANRKRQYLAMLKDPNPKIVRSAGAILTALDDIQDAVSTLAVVGLIAATVIGGTTATVLSGPLGWVIAGSAVLNFINPFSKFRLKGKLKPSGRGQKKLIERLSDKNPFSKESRLKSVKNITRFRPSIGNLLEALQTTDQIFGIGLSLGPIMGFGQGLISGTVRKILGQKVSFDFPPNPFPGYIDTATRMLKAAVTLNAIPWRTQLQDLALSFIGMNLALQAIAPFQEEYDPFTEVPDLANFELEAPKIHNILIQEIILEAGNSIEESEVWPQNGRKWISYSEMSDSTSTQATENLNFFADKYKNEALAFAAINNAHDYALGLLEVIEGPNQVEMEYSITERVTLIILDNGWVYPDDTTEAQIKIFEDWVGIHELLKIMPSSKEIWRFPIETGVFTWQKSEFEFR